jgi:hypothetical protein
MDLAHDVETKVRAPSEMELEAKSLRPRTFQPKVRLLIFPPPILGLKTLNLERQRERLTLSAAL